jgi:hypothetical protein
MRTSYQSIETTVRIIINEELQRNEKYFLTIFEIFENDEDFQNRECRFVRKFRERKLKREIASAFKKKKHVMKKRMQNHEMIKKRRL